MRTINIIGEINDKTVKNVLEEIFKIEEEDNEIILENEKFSDEIHHKKLKDLTINITSVGGYTYGFSAIYDALSKLKCKVITRGYGLCSSAGFYLLLAGEERYAGKHTEFLYHTVGYNKPYELLHHHAIYAEHSKRIQKKLDEIVINKTKITKEMLNQYKKEDWWMLYEEALELGVIHGEIQ